MVDLSHRIHKSNRPLLLFTQVCFAISLPLAYVLSSYFQRGRFDQFFLNDAVDTPPVPGDFYPGPLGVHTFGDFLQPLWQSRLTPSPYIAGNSSYLPGANGVFWLFSWLPYWPSFLLFLAISLTTLSFPFWKAESNLDTWSRIGLVLGGVWLTYPLLFALDRGNIQLLTVGFIVLAFYSSSRNRPVLAGVCLGAAICLKAYPVLFLIIFLRRKSWRTVTTTIGTAGLCTALPLVLFGGGLLRNTRALISNLSSSQEELSSLSLYANNSLKALGLSMRSAGLDGFANIFSDYSAIIFGFLLLAIFCLSLLRECDDLEIALLVATVSCLAVTFSPGYVLLLFLVPAFFIYHHLSHLPNKWVVFYSGIIALLLMPKQLPMQFWKDSYLQSSPSVASLVNPLIMVILVLVILTRVLYSIVISRQHKGSSPLPL